jgi:hypothetical protein
MTAAHDVEIVLLRAVYEAARGLCHGTDWNRGTHALHHGYRRRLIEAVNAVEQLAKGVANV